MTNFINWLKRNRTDIGIGLVIFLLAAVPRLTDLGVFLTADEKNWMGRSYEFIRAFKDWRFNDMLQTTHPGVTTMWLAGASITLKMIVSSIPFSFGNLVHFVSAAQWPIALANSLAIPAVYVILRFIVRSRILPVTAAGLIALNPFFIGYSRVIHVDALLASFLLLAGLAIIVYARKSYDRRWLVASAVLAALAMLTKAPGVFAVPYFIFVVVAMEGRGLFRKDIFLQRARDFTIWLIILALVFLVLWPALLWVPNPEGNVLLLKRDIGQAALTPHHMVEDYTLNAWHYPAALLARSTPVNLTLSTTAVVIAIASLVRTRRISQDDKFLWLIAAYCLFFVVMMTLGAKKGDRYIMPVFPALDLLAAIGLGKVLGYITAARRKIAFAARVAIAAYMLFVVYSYHPYAIAYSNPLFPENLSQELGWGEGLEQVGAWLSQLQTDALVASWYPEELAAYTSAKVAHINAHEQGQVGYVVLYRNMFGRAVDHPANDFIDEYYKKKEPVKVFYVAGREYAWVYAKPVYRYVTGELLPGQAVGQEVAATHDGLRALDLLVATYSGKANRGSLNVLLRRGDRSGAVIHEWHMPIKEIENDRWLTLTMPDQVIVDKGSKLFVEISASGTTAGNAPTLRYARGSTYRDTDIYISDTGSIDAGDQKDGDLALRLRYAVGSQLVTEYDTRLLSDR